jgi:hypothetical protein
MANDPPTNLRMGFGYQQARASGVTGFKSPPKPWEMNFHIKWAAAEKTLRRIVKRDPSIKPLVHKFIGQQKAVGEYSAENILYAVLWTRPDLAPAGYWDLLPKAYWPPQLKWDTTHVSQMLSTLADVGLVYKNRHGKYSLAVPLLAQFIQRQTTADSTLKAHGL